MKRSLPILAFAVMLFAVMNFSSCEKYILPEIKFAQDTLSVDASAHQLQQTVTSNVAWEIASVPLWCAIEIEETATGAILHLSISENDGDMRESKINVESASLRKGFTLIQEGKPTPEEPADQTEPSE
ncbi:MAG: BACON domain-containing protein [Bacteroidales bacterium]|nr:BACON domain-containing protein [Bacteroidales bacterium]